MHKSASHAALRQVLPMQSSIKTPNKVARSNLESEAQLGAFALWRDPLIQCFHLHAGLSAGWAHARRMPLMV